MIEKERKRKKLSAAARERRRRQRRRIILAERITISLLVVILLVGGTTLAWNLIPGIKIARQLEEANGYVETQDFEEALASCEEALEIDSKSIQAYRAMAGVYLTQEDWESAEQVLYRGWETTQDETLLQEYCVHLLNDAVSDINSQECTLATLEKCVQVIEQNQMAEDSYKLLEACYERLFAADETELFCNAEMDGKCGFQKYFEIMNRLLTACEANQDEALKERIVKLADPKNPVLWMEVEHLQDYQELLSKVAALDEGGQIQSLGACIDKAIWAQDTFAEAFEIFESGEFERIKDYMQSDTYISIRDQFIGGTMEYWSGMTYIPVSREKMLLMYENGERSFSFADFDDCPDTTGVVKIWGTKQEDAGVQRICISYEPESAYGDYYPHTTYEFIYLYSNVQIGRDEYVPQMNYRFETKTATQEGTITHLVGDWGGDHEWTSEY